MNTRKGNTWIQALKEFNKGHSGTWCIVKKGSKEYDEVKGIMQDLKTYDGKLPNKQYEKPVKPKKLINANQQYKDKASVGPKQKKMTNKERYDKAIKLKVGDIKTNKCPVCDHQFDKTPSKDEFKTHVNSDKHKKVLSNLKFMLEFDK